MPHERSEPAGRDSEGLIDARTSSRADEPLARQLRGFRPVGVLAILIILAGNFLVVPLSAVLVLVWVRWSGTQWCEIGYVRPRSWFGDLMVGVAIGVAFKLLMKAVVLPLLGAPPVNEAYQHLAGNVAAIPATLFMLIVGAGFGEETVYRGFLFERLGKLLGSSVRAKALIVVSSAALFGLAHYADQGLAGAQQALIVGLVFGDLRGERRTLDADVRARGVRSDRVRADLLGRRGARGALVLRLDRAHRSPVRLPPFLQ